MKIYCENRFCIYFEGGKCILDVISLDAIGVCTEGIRVDIEEEFLAVLKKKLLAKFELRDNG